jgi:aryl-alcohol dehydrogenase-like predicted oxidoreductase
VIRRRLGGLEVSAVGLGCMGMSEFRGPADPAESRATIRRALDLGVTLLDTSDSYGMGANERLVGEAIRGRREEAVVATKFGILRGPGGSFAGRDGRPEYVRRACRASLRRLGVERIDLYYCHRLDPRVPVEETVGAMAGLVAEGLVGHLGLSAARPEQIRRAAAVHPIAALQSEYSPWARGLEAEVVPLLRELGIGLVAYAPLGRGTLPAQAPEPARARGISPAQLALAWLLSRGPDVVPIPGTARRDHLEENAAAARIELSADELREVEAARWGP